MSSELSFAIALVNPSIRTEIRKACSEINWSSSLAKEIVKFFLEDNKKILPPMAEIRIFLAGFLQEEEIDKTCEKFKEFIQVKSNDIDNILEDFDKFYQNKRVTEILRDSNSDPQYIVQNIKSLTGRGTTKVPVYNLGLTA